MDWMQVITIAGSTIAACLFFRRETKIQLTTMEQHGRERDQEMKDFHGRLCALEEKYIQMMERFLENRK